MLSSQALPTTARIVFHIVKSGCLYKGMHCMFISVSTLEWHKSDFLIFLKSSLSQQTFGPSCFDKALAILIVYSLGLDQPRNTRTASLWLLQENILNFHMVGHFLNSLHFLKSSISTLANSLRRVNGTVSITSMPRSPKCVQI